MIIDVHALHPLPPSNVNRDKEGQPKTCLFGGVTRHSVSSASWKHRTKDVIEDRLLAEGKQDRALRTRRAAPRLSEELLVYPEWAEDEALRVATYAFSKFVKIEKPAKAKAKASADSGADPDSDVDANEDDNDTDTQISSELLLLCVSQYVDLGALIHQNRPLLLAVTSEVKMTAKAKAAAVEVAKAVARDEAIAAGLPAPKDPLKAFHDAVASIVGESRGVISLLGRMIADLPKANVNASVSIAAALSVAEGVIEEDFFTAVDDVAADDGNKGAAHMGYKAFTSSTLYRYASLDKDSLEHNTGNARDATRLARHFLHAFLNCVPQGNVTNSGQNVSPNLVVLTVRNNGNSLVMAFERPVKDYDAEGYIRPAITALTEYAAIQRKMIVKPIWVGFVNAVDGSFDASLSSVFGESHDHLDDLIEAAITAAGFDVTTPTP